MPPRSNTPNNNTATFNKHGLQLVWPRIWIIILGIILIFLCFAIAGMEIGHTLSDLRRSNAFGGFIVFLPLIICAILILVTACKPTLILLRITTVLCFIMIILCLALIAYDILVLIDPTRCFFLSCNDATVNISNSTTIITTNGWPLNITWPDYFLTTMNTIKIFQSVQILCACLFILFTSLYILTYCIYRRVNLHHKEIYQPDQHTYVTHEKHRTSIKQSNNTVQPYPQYNHHQPITVYSIQPRSSVSLEQDFSPRPVVVHAITPRKIRTETIERPRASSVNYDRICTRCMQEPRMTLRTDYERQNFFSHLCVNCNNELLSYGRKPTARQRRTSRSWKPY